VEEKNIVLERVSMATQSGRQRKENHSGYQNCTESQSTRKGLRQRFTAEYKLRIFKKAESFKELVSLVPGYIEKELISPISSHGNVGWEKGAWKFSHPKKK